MDEIISILISPSNLITWLLLIAVASYLMRLRKLSTILCLIAASIYFILGSGPVSQLLLSSLEYRYPSYELADRKRQEISTIVVLTGAAEAKPDTPISSHLNASSAYRVLEARRIYLLHPESNIVISGLGSTPGILKMAMLNLDIPESKISVDSESTTTYESAINLKRILHDKDFILVTSAGHMPRSIATFEYQGMKPIPAPTEFISRKNIYAAQYLPTPRHMVYSELAVHEYLGMVWYRMTGRM